MKKLLTKSISDGLKNLIAFIMPPEDWKLPVILLTGIFCGIVLLVFYLSNAASYLSDEPEACINCHVMIPYYVTWRKGSHARFTTCNDCHVPHDSYIKKYLFKMKDGSRHAFMFTFNLQPQVIRLKSEGSEVVYENCLRCHSPLFEKMEPVNGFIHTSDHRKCWGCHRETPHSRFSSLSSTTNVRGVPVHNPVPEWIRELTKKKNIKGE